MTPDHQAEVVSLATAVAIGALAFHYCVGFAVVAPGALDWIYSGGVDPSAHFTGWHLFRSGPWEVPPGSVGALGHPVGTSVGLTDSIPLLAIALKPFHAFLPRTFQYLGMWLLACFLLQGLFGALLMGCATRSVGLRVLGASLFVLSPVLANRLNHAALCAHWLILAALWLNRRQASNGQQPNLFAWVLVTAISAATHPYLTLMVLAVAGATIVSSFDGLRQWLVGTSSALVLLGAVSAAVWWACGYFIVDDASALQGSGFGRFSMNLLSPVVPPPGALTHGWLGVFTTYGEQHEGFAYMGLGGALLLGVALPLVRLHAPRWRGDVILGLVCLGLTIFALSPVVTLGTTTVVEYPPTWWGPLMAFRATGRLFWPVFYTGLFALLALVVRRLPATAASAVLLVAVFLQGSDVRGFYELKRHDFALRMPEPLPSTFWEVVLPKYRHLVLYPSNMCAPMEQSLDYRFFALRAGHAGATINGGFAARYDVRAVREYCETFLRNIREGNVSDDSLYAVATAVVPVMRAARSPIACVPVDGVSACFTARSHDGWASDFRANALWLPPLADFVRFRSALEAEYRDRLRRSAIELPGTADERTDSVVRYLGYRVGGCDASEALEHVLAERAGRQGGSLCREQSFLPRPLPPVAEIHSLYATIMPTIAAPSATHLDQEGEILWTRVYAEERLRGRSDIEASGTVLAAIRDIAGR